MDQNSSNQNDFAESSSQLKMDLSCIYLLEIVVELLIELLGLDSNLQCYHQGNELPIKNDEK